MKRPTLRAPYSLASGRRAMMKVDRPPGVRSSIAEESKRPFSGYLPVESLRLVGLPEHSTWIRQPRWRQSSNYPGSKLFRALYVKTNTLNGAQKTMGSNWQMRGGEVT